MKNLMMICCLSFLSLYSYGQTITDVSKTTKKVVDGIEIIIYQNQPLTGVLTQSYANGKPKSWTEMKNGRPDGLWQEWYENGKLKFNAYWTEGKGHGLWEYYHENGALRQEEFYDMDLPIGVH